MDEWLDGGCAQSVVNRAAAAAAEEGLRINVMTDYINLHDDDIMETDWN